MRNSRGRQLKLRVERQIQVYVGDRRRRHVCTRASINLGSLLSPVGMGSLFYHALLERINLFSIQAVSCIQNATFFRLPVVAANPCRPIIPGAVAGRMATTKYASCFSQHVRRSWAEPNNQGRPHDINITVTWSPGASFLCCLISHNTR